MENRLIVIAKEVEAIRNLLVNDLQTEAEATDENQLLKIFNTKQELQERLKQLNEEHLILIRALHPPPASTEHYIAAGPQVLSSLKEEIQALKEAVTNLKLNVGRRKPKLAKRPISLRTEVLLKVARAVEM